MNGQKLAAYSCGGSFGIAAYDMQRTEFPLSFYPTGGQKNHRQAYSADKRPTCQERHKDFFILNLCVTMKLHIFISQIQINILISRLF
ncbi:hypothetical protein TH9_20370 [Thalassospira xiamenensis]|nr:hypothetical protein TH9_20370 [Thalassospira xiamenensis]